jgi:nucleotide-binding universal stress UspA family protein
MSEVRPGGVVVGVDGSRAARQAVLWAAGAARLRGLPLTIARVEPPARDAAGLPDEQLSALDLLESSRRAARPDRDLEVRLALISESWVAASLVRLSESAAVVALGVDVYRRRASYGPRGPIEDRVAVHALCPVVAVGPFAWLDDSRSRPPQGGRVVLGWSPGVSGRQAMDAAAEEAHLRGARLVVVRAQPHDPSSRAGHPAGPDDEPTLITAVAEVERRHPGLSIDIRHYSGEAADALSGLVADASLLVLGCHHSRQPASIRTGPVAQALLRDGRCPVMLVGHRSTAPAAREPRPQTPATAP